jgi:cytochrome c
VLSRFAAFILGAFAIAGGALFFNFFAWEGGRKHLPDHYKNFVRKTAITISFTSIVILPIFLMINVLVLPDIALSGTVYSYAIVAILLVFLVLHFIYAMIKYSTTRYSIIVFFVILFIIFSTVITNEMAMSNATHLQSVILSSKFEAYLNTFKGETTGKVAVRSGEEIYETVCSACHRFDKVVVGPAYDDVLPQFEGKKDALVAFIRNPYKVNPKFPPMPNPGLKLEEAQNIADYEIIHHMQDVFPERRKEAGNDGEKIFNRICAACHAFDHPVVGPAFDEVLTKYIGKPDDLIKFVGNPQKINPNYPQMPNPGLDQPQLKAITTYVLSEYRKRK